MLVIGLTGGIASGKSLVAEQFAKLGVTIIDTDQLSRELVAPGQPALEKIAHHFGAKIVDEVGQLNRKELRELIFNEVAEREWLENLLHPLIRELMKQRIDAVTSPYCIAVIPLLVEKQANPLINRILVVDTSLESQEQRLLKRDKISKEQAQQIFASQASREQRLASAEDIIQNQDSIESLQAEVLKLHNQYLRLASEQ